MQRVQKLDEAIKFAISALPRLEKLLQVTEQFLRHREHVRWVQRAEENACTR